MKALTKTLIGLLAPLLVGQAAELHVSDATFVVPNEATILVPLEVTFAVGELVQSLETQLSLPSQWEITGIQTSGHLIENWNATLNHTFTGHAVSIAFASDTEMVGTGVLLELEVRIHGSGWVNIGTTSANEGLPEITTDNGYLTHTLPPVISVFPSQAQVVLVGDQVQYSRSGGTAPFSWSVDPPTLGSISSDGLFTAVSQGSGNVLISGSAGAVGTSSLVQVHPFALGFAPVDTIAGSTVGLALELENPNALPINSFQVEIVIQQSRVTAAGIQSTGFLCEGWGQLLVQLTGNRLLLAGASESPVSSAGTLLELELSTSVGNAFNLNLLPVQVSINEDSDIIARNATQHFSASGSFSVTPNTATLKRGEDLQFTVSGDVAGVPTWASSNSAFATIDAAGLLTAVGGGQLHVLATDALGQTVSSDWIQVVDLDCAPADTIAAIGSEFLIPLWVDLLPGTAIEALEFELNWNSPWLTCLGVENPGCLLEPWTEWGELLEEGRAVISGAGPAESLNGALLCALRFSLSPDTPSNLQIPLQLSTMVINEGTPVVRVSNGRITAGISAQRERITEPDQLTLLPAWPNPFNPDTRLSFLLPQAGHAVLTVYDLQGARIASLLSAQLSAGVHRIRWDGLNRSGQAVASGIYLVQLQTQGGQRVQRVTLLR